MIKLLGFTQVNMKKENYIQSQTFVSTCTFNKQACSTTRADTRNTFILKQKNIHMHIVNYITLVELHSQRKNRKRWLII